MFVTAKVNSADEVQGFAMGAVDYITKPISAARVVARVRTHLNLRAAYKKLEEQHTALLEMEQLRQDMGARKKEYEKQLRSLYSQDR